LVVNKEYFIVAGFMAQVMLIYLAWVEQIVFGQVLLRLFFCSH
jgi:hypothetical protein